MLLTQWIAADVADRLKCSKCAGKNVATRPLWRQLQASGVGKAISQN